MIEMSNKFTDWIVQQINERGWSIRETARRAGLAASTISDVINGNAKPGTKFYRGLARAFKIPLSIVLHQAGEDASIPEDKEQDKELLSYFHDLDYEYRLIAIGQVSNLRETQAKYKVQRKEKG